VEHITSNLQPPNPGSNSKPSLLPTLHSARFMMVSCVAHFSTLKMEAVCSFETTFDFHQLTQRCVPEDRTLHLNQLRSTINLFEININIILSYLSSPSDAFVLGLPTKSVHAFLISSVRDITYVSCFLFFSSITIGEGSGSTKYDAPITQFIFLVECLMYYSVYPYKHRNSHMCL
jgi:hypothetical protein